jgi:hypothetical protein
MREERSTRRIKDKWMSTMGYWVKPRSYLRTKIKLSEGTRIKDQGVILSICACETKWVFEIKSHECNF